MINLAGAADWTKDIDETNPTGNFVIAEQAGPGTTAEIEVDDEVEEKSLAYIASFDRTLAPWVSSAKPRVMATQTSSFTQTRPKIDLKLLLFRPFLAFLHYTTVIVTQK